jgi:hypothetical protein
MTIRIVCVLIIVGVALTPTSVASALEIDVACTANALVDAINAANQNNEAAILSLDEGCVYTLSAVDNTIDGSNGLPSIGSDIEIHGNGAVVMRATGENTPPFRVLHVAGGGKLSIDRLTILNGWAYDESECKIEAWGGGILNTGSLSLTDSVLSSSRACQGAGLYSSGIVSLTNSIVSGNSAFVGDLPQQQDTGRGGGIYVGGANSETRLLFSTVRNNSAFVNGGGLYNGNDSELVVINSTVSGNSAGNIGGGIFNLLLTGTGMLRIEGSLVSGNNAGYQGGGIYNAENHNLEIVNSTISGNNAVDGGGVYSEGTGGVSLANSTVTANSATRRTGGIYNGWSSVVNTSTITMSNTIVAAQLVGQDCTYSAGVDSLGHNLDSDGSCVTDGANGDMTNSTPGLDALADNGGQTLTHALLADSPAVDNGNDGSCPASDQRGVSRPQGRHCDIGSFEYGGNIAGSTPKLSIDYGKGASGSIFRLSATGFPPDDAVWISVNDIDLYVLHADAKGAVDFRIDTAGVGAGVFQVTVGAASSSSVSFQIDPESPLRQISGTGPTFRLPFKSGLPERPELYLPMLRG